MSFDEAATTSQTSSFVSGTTTEPNTPNIDPARLALFARLIPLNRPARRALENTAQASSDGVDYHQNFIGEAVYNRRQTTCYDLSLDRLPQFAHIGWRIGRGRFPVEGRHRWLENYGVDLLLSATEEEDVAGIHARFNWVKGAGGFFLIADNKRGKPVMMNGEFFSSDRRSIPLRNVIMLGECIFTLDYTKRTPTEEEQFQLELAAFYRKFHGEENPLVLPTPGESDASFGEWVIQYAISRGTFGVVYMVTHSRNGIPAAAKQILKTNRNKASVDREIEMARRVSELKHERVASPFEISHQKTRSKAEVARVKALLDESWDPTLNSIMDEYIILSPLLVGTFRSLYRSGVPEEDRAVFFSQLLDAVAFLHDEGIWHRDIKPDNILVRHYDPPEAMLTDFGCASDEEEILYDRAGTVLYLAPEQVEGQTHGRAVDYWASALVGVELMGGPETSQRIWPGDMLTDYQEWLESSKSPMAGPCRAMLEVQPQSRMTASEALGRLTGWLDQHHDQHREESDPRKRRKFT